SQLCQFTGAGAIRACRFAKTCLRAGIVKRTIMRELHSQRRFGNSRSVPTQAQTLSSVEPLEARTFLSASSLDTSFNGSGKVSSTFGTGTYFNSVVALPDGKVLAAGTVINGAKKNDFLVARYNAYGTPDTSFGSGTGHVFTDFGSTDDQGVKLLLLTGG